MRRVESLTSPHGSSYPAPLEDWGPHHAPQSNHPKIHFLPFPSPLSSHNTVPDCNLPKSRGLSGAPRHMLAHGLLNKHPPGERVTIGSY